MDIIKSGRNAYSRIGLGLFLYLAITIVVQLAAQLILNTFAPHLLNEATISAVITMAPQYVCAFPVLLLIFRGAPATKRPRENLGPSRYFTCLLIAFFLLYAGNIFGMIVNSVLESVFHTSGVSPIQTVTESWDPRLLFLFTVVLAPIIEEVICRKEIIDRTQIYGEKTAVVTSALFFGLLHGNFSQFFYAFGLGLVFGYIYVRTRRIRYSVTMHMIINFFGAIMPTLLLGQDGLRQLSDLATSGAGSEQIMQFMRQHATGMAVLILYALIVVIGGSIAGLVLLIAKRKRITFFTSPYQLPKGRRFSTAWLNPGVLLFLLISAAQFVLNLILL